VTKGKDGVKNETFAAAKKRLLAELAVKGWKTRPDLKVPWAEPKGGEYRLWFRPHSIYLNEHSMFLESRGLSVETLIETAERYAKREP